VLELGCGLGLPSLAAALRARGSRDRTGRRTRSSCCGRTPSATASSCASPASLERAGAAAPRRAVGSRPRRRPPLRGAQRRAARRSAPEPRRRGAARRAGRRTRRSFSSGSRRRPSVSGSTGCSLLMPCSPPRPVDLARGGSGAAHVLEADPVRPEAQGRDGRVRQEALRHPLLASPPEGDRRALHRSNSFSATWNDVRGEHADRSSASCRARARTSSSTGRPDLPARAA
jgi:hypothetical protein